MSQVLINRYLNDLANLKKVSGTSRETVVREAFKDLLKSWGKSLDLTFIPEYEVETKTKERRYVDGALLHALRVPFGYWEAKDEKDDIDTEIETKLRRGYPKTNIIFEDSQVAVLLQNSSEIMRCAVDDVGSLEKLLKLFFGYERPEIEAFRNAVDQFKTDLPAVLNALRSMIDKSYLKEAGFRKAASEFLAHAKEAINPSLVDADVREMLIQHILTGEVFDAVFPGTTYHEDNSVARELHKLEATFFTGNTKHQTLKGLVPYYGAIRKTAVEITGHHEKQTFLKAVYENFYRVYNPKAADRLGVVYTPNEVVRFMIQTADWLCEHHFNRSLIDKDVDILDPATGTGTFITELIEHFSGQPVKLQRKYRSEIHANEVAILPYYVANLNIEATYAAVTGAYEEFPGLCLVDTLDNTFALRKHSGHMDDIFGTVSDDNIKRIRQQNSRRISVIIGNPPYNANQLNENENNKNREYPEIDKRIKETYIDSSTAQKTKLYDMYARFLRWASDRVDENGIVAFVSNSSFINSRTFDGFRKCVAEEFSEIRIIDLKGNARTSGERRRQEGGNVFDDQIRVGVAVYFLVKKKGTKRCRIFYESVRDYAKADEKREFLVATPLQERVATELVPDLNYNWIDTAENDFSTLLPLIAQKAKEKAVFTMRTNGVNTARDEWVYDFDSERLLAKMDLAVRTFNSDHRKIIKAGKYERAELSDTIKWSEGLINKVQRAPALGVSKGRIVQAEYRPFVSMAYYADPIFSDRLTSLHARIFGDDYDQRRPCIAVSAPSQSRQFYTLAVNRCADWHFLGDTQIYPLETYEEGQTSDNITDSVLAAFRKQYKAHRTSGKAREISKIAIFHYVYAVLHDPEYRQKYVLNLKREFPRIPYKPDFWKWSKWGQTLMDLHLNYEDSIPFPFMRTDTPDKNSQKAGLGAKVVLKADKDGGRIIIDSETTLSGIPIEAWEYKLGNRSALEWVLEQYRERSPSSPTIRAKFASYQFSTYKEAVVTRLARVTNLSINTVKVITEMSMLS